MKEKHFYDLLDSLDLQPSDFLKIINAWGQLSNSEKAEVKAKISTMRAAPINYKLIMDTYNNICKSLPRVTVMSKARKKAVKARFNDKYTYSDFEKLFRMAEESDFLKGKGGKGWRATFDWLITDTNMAKVIDNGYKNNTAQPRKKSSYDISEFEALLNKPLTD